jgi:hypothetical protein
MGAAHCLQRCFRAKPKPTVNVAASLRFGRILAQASHLYTSICEGVYHGGRRVYECADSLDFTQHENWKKRARILEAGKRLKIMQTGCGVHHGFQQEKGQRCEGLSRAMRLRCSGVLNLRSGARPDTAPPDSILGRKFEN